MTRILLKVARAATALALLTAVSAQTSTAAAPGAIQTLDCYSSFGSLKSLGTYTFQTSGYCQKQCAAQNQAVMATTGGSTCLCGNDVPPESAKVDTSNCQTPCDGYDQENCGGSGFYQVYLTGLGSAGTDSGSGSGSSSSTPTSGNTQSTTSAKPSVITKAGQTIIVTASATSDPNSGGGSSGGGGSKVAIAVGVVVGILAVAAIVGGIILFLKRRRNKAIEEEHRRNAAVSSFVSPKSETSSTTDQRLNPVAFGMRPASGGSIADERDFSRRILAVRNPDRDSRASRASNMA